MSTYAEGIEQARDKSIPDALLSRSQQIVRLFFEGTALRAASVADRLGVSRSFLQVVVRDMEDHGYVFRVQDGLGPSRNEKSYLLLNPENHPVLTEAGQARRESRNAMARDRKQGKRIRARRTGAARPRPRPPVEAVEPAQQAVEPTPIVLHKSPFPGLGENVTVSLLSLDEEGNIKVGIKNGDQSWLCQIVGFTS